MIDLEGGVLDSKVRLEQLLELGAHAVAVVARRHEHVRREGGEAGADLPDMQIVDVRDTRVLLEAAPSLGGGRRRRGT
jgi:hypothetical protein